MNDNHRQDAPTSPEWLAFRDDVVAHRTRLERILRREMVHDPRSANVRVHNVSARDLADEALCEVLGDWKQKPAGTGPFQWMAKRGLRLLDETLDRESLAAESRAEERAEEGRLLAHDLTQDDEERARWLEIAGLSQLQPGDEDAAPPITDAREAPNPFDGLASSPDTSSPEARLQQAETLAELERALLRLPDERRRAIAHRYLDGLAIEEICYLLDASAEHVETEIRAGLVSLRNDLARS